LNLFELLTWHQKMMFFLHPFSCIFVRRPAAPPPCWPPPFRSVLLFFQTTHGWEKSGRAMVRSPVWHQSVFQSVSSPGPHRVRGMTVSLLGPLSCFSLFLSGQQVLHRSEQTPKTIALYYTPSNYRGR
jgi:hypothetical protein